MQRLKRALIWLSRIRYVRGFGIQSPTDYRFVRYVVNEHDPYYKYEELETAVAPLDPLTRKLCCLYFRLSNYCQSEVFVDVLSSTSAYATYVRAACAKTIAYTVERCDVQLQMDTDKALLARITWQKGVEPIGRSLMDHAPDGSVVVVEGIKSCRDVKRFWESMIRHPRMGASYDLYYCGIIIIDNCRYKKNYIINF